MKNQRKKESMLSNGRDEREHSDGHDNERLPRGRRCGEGEWVAAVHNARLQNEAWSWFPCVETDKNRTDFQPTFEALCLRRTRLANHTSRATEALELPTYLPTF